MSILPRIIIKNVLKIEDDNEKRGASIDNNEDTFGYEQDEEDHSSRHTESINKDIGHIIQQHR